MRIDLYVRNDREVKTQCSFQPGTFEYERAILVEVPHGSRFIGVGDLTCLQTSNGIVHTPLDVLCLSRERSPGFHVLD